MRNTENINIDHLEHTPNECTYFKIVPTNGEYLALEYRTINGINMRINSELCSTVDYAEKVLSTYRANFWK